MTTDSLIEALDECIAEAGRSFAMDPSGHIKTARTFLSDLCEGRLKIVDGAPVAHRAQKNGSPWFYKDGGEPDPNNDYWDTQEPLYRRSKP